MAVCISLTLKEAKSISSTLRTESALAGTYEPYQWPLFSERPATVCRRQWAENHQHHQRRQYNRLPPRMRGTSYASSMILSRTRRVESISLIRLRVRHQISPLKSLATCTIGDPMGRCCA